MDDVGSKRQHMNSGVAPDGLDRPDPWLGRDWTAGLLLFFATAGVVVWQNLQVGVLWDLSYILENAHRISLGDFPYRDFPLPYAPLTFLIQASIIKLSGRVFFHHIIYSATVGGAATVLTWRILQSLLRDAVASPRLVAFLLSAPLMVLGIYCIFPHPFYDPDCTFVILLCIYLLQRLERAGFPPLGSFLTGAALVVPLFVKQNAGLAFLGSAVLAVVALMAVAARCRQTISGYALLMAGATLALAAATVLIHLTVGLANYWHWTIQFAAARRAPSFALMAAPYTNPALWGWVAAFVAGAALLRIHSGGDRLRGRWTKRLIAVVSVVLMSAPFAWPVIYLLIDNDSSERAERLLALWPFVLIVSFGFALLSIRRKSGISSALPFIVIGTVQGAFLSQQLWGSTYALWPLLMILVACTIAAFPAEQRVQRVHEMRTFVYVVAATMLVSSGFYAASHERLAYANVFDDDMARSALPALAGLSVRGPWIPQFEELVRFAEREIPRDDGLLMIPGEDLFYYTTGRHPRFPVLMFDHTVNPYSPEEIVALSRAGNIRWLVIKRNLQLEEQPMKDQDRVLDLLRQDFKPLARLDNYDIYRRN
jgi:hypothetical protein